MNLNTGQFRKTQLRISGWWMLPPGAYDLVILLCGLVAVTFQPFYLYGLINLNEAGLYLPGIDAVLKGQIPYRDFFHLRGPLEIYFQALWMRLAGEDYYVLPTYFYVGGIMTLAMFLLIAKELLKTRLFLYTMSLAFIARTFPRVSLTIGGGFRHVWGAAAIYFMIRYFKVRHRPFLWLAGFFSAVALMTSMEIGAYSFAGIFVVLLLEARFSINKLFSGPLMYNYTTGVLSVLVPLIIFLQSHQALAGMLDAFHQVFFNMTKTFPAVDPAPRNILETLAAMFNPESVNFKHLTPLFCYLGGSIYLLKLYRNGKNCLGASCVFAYGLLFFIGSMRDLWGPGFENAIQPEKVLFFFLLERAWFYLNDRKERYARNAAAVLLAGILLSTLIYSIGRFYERFSIIKIISSNFLFSGHDLVLLDFPRMKKMVVPQKQAQDMLLLYRFFNIHSGVNDRVMFFPDIGAYNFIVNRPFVGRFPIASLSWIDPGWCKEFMKSLKVERPRYVVTYKTLPGYILKTQFIVPANTQHYKDVVAYISQHYHTVSATPSFNISVSNK